MRTAPYIAKNRQWRMRLPPLSALVLRIYRAVVHSFHVSLANRLPRRTNQLKRTLCVCTCAGVVHVRAGLGPLGFSPTFNAIIADLSEYFDLDVYATRLNFYPDGSSWKPFHHDSHAYGGRKLREDLTVGASFGSTRTLEFKHASSGHIFGFPQNNNDIFAFTTKVRAYVEAQNAHFGFWCTHFEPFRNTGSLHVFVGH